MIAGAAPVVPQGAYYGQMVGLPGELWQMLTQLNRRGRRRLGLKGAAKLDRRSGLHIPRVDVGCPTT